MRILHLVHQYLPEFVGGTELYTRNLAQLQAARRRNVVAVVAPSLAEGRAVGQLPVAEAGVAVYRLPVGRRSGTARFLHTFAQPALSRAAAGVLDAFKPDILHIQHLMGWPLSVVERAAARGVPIVITLHDYWFPCANAQLLTNYDGTVCDGPDSRRHNCAHCALARAGHGERTGLKPWVAPVLRQRDRLLRRAFDRAAAVIAPTEFVRRTLAENGFDSPAMVVVRHGIDVPRARIAAARAAARPRLADRVFRVAFVGGLSPQKGIHVLIDAVNQLPADGVQLSIAGDETQFPDYVAGLKAQATHPGIRFLGRVPHEQVWEIYASADAVVMPTLWYEASPLTIDEVFAVGAPLVASRLGAMAEKIADGENGLLFPPGDAAALAAILRRLYESPALGRRLRAAAPRVRTVAEHAADIEAVYRRAAAG